MLKKINKKYKGQTTLLIVIMVMAVSLGIGVAVTQRQTSNLRKTTYTSQTDQGFSCANSGVEKALLCIKEEEATLSPNVIGDCIETNTSLDNCNYSYTVADLLPTAGQITLAKLPKDNVQQFTLADNTDKVTVEFSNFSNYSDPVAVELTYAYYDGSEYNMLKKLVGCNISGVTGIKGFENLAFSVSSCKYTWSIPTSSENVLRIRTYLADATLKLEANGDFKNVSQGYVINSSGTAGNVTRKIEVYRMNPQLPALFDYVLYSEEGSITK